MTQEINLIVAMSESSRGIGYKQKLPWNIPADLKHFKKITSSHAVIMGRNTWYSIPKEYRPFNNRLNVVLSRAVDDFGVGVSVAKNFSEALFLCRNYSKVFIIGGESVYKRALTMNIVDNIYITEVFGLFKCDTFFPYIDTNSLRKISESPVAESNGHFFRFLVYQKHDEYQYLNLIKDVLTHGVISGDRTRTGTKRLFGKTMCFNLSENMIPLITTKRTYWKGIVAELLWFISGSTDTRVLQDQGVRIWDGNSSREFLDSVGLQDNVAGDIGAGYGFQWRHFGAEYRGCDADYTGHGIDQLANVIELIRKEPNSRRIVLSAWNPTQLKQTALPPCHVLIQFQVVANVLNSVMYQRSADIGLGVPFNIASYALLTHMIAHITGLKAGTFTHMIADAHIYLNHVKSLYEQAQRNPIRFPTIAFSESDKITEIDDFNKDNIRLLNYKFDNTRLDTMKMAV